MPLTEERVFRVRSYECDAYGHVNHANYLRYMQEAAFDAAAAAGYDATEHAASGRSWLIRETDVEFLRPLRYGESVRVRTWVADFRRVRSLRAYELRLTDTLELVARGSTDWVYLDTASGRPAPIPEEMKLAFVPEGVPETTPSRQRFPKAPPPPPGVFRQRRRVEWRDLDQVQHVNNAVYLAYIEDCGVQMAAARGWPIARLQEDGHRITARQHRIEYRAPAMLGDMLHVSMWLSNIGRTSFSRHTTVTRPGDGALVARAHTVHQWMAPGTGKPTAIPHAFLADAASDIADNEAADH